MDYNIIIETISEIVNNDLIYKEGLTLEYTLDEKFHMKLDEHFFYKGEHGDDEIYEYNGDFEVELGGILIKFKVNE